MEMYKLIKSLTPEKIIFCNLKGSGCNNSGKYLISENISEDEQIITILHEMLHDHSNYKGKSAVSKPNIDIENEIEYVAKRAFKKQHIKSYILMHMNKAKSFDINKKMNL